ncbi:MAG: hypothetical protein K2Q15_10890 [Burkholderiales bacterium]|nr:hypothetical protein [Burkholderiales bacterium]
MANAAYHLTDIPDGMQIFEDRLPVAGISYQAEAAARFVQDADLWIEFERDHLNVHDKNAIKVIGCAGYGRSARYFLGYVPAEIAAKIVEKGYFDQVKPRLLKTYLSEGGYVEILFQLLGLKGRRAAYGKPANAVDSVAQVKYLKEERRHKEAIALLLKVVNKTEKEALRKNQGVAPWCYEELAIIYRKENQLDKEIAILERFEEQPKSPGAMPAKLAERLLNVRLRLNKTR